ncbi:serine--tRNA ligase [Qipengyuania spongiae]|uniref:Serine--tRNA ligase n=1 Tax=Qipengyuania spongiae TaxID=2909673 RepID=A0ABY5T0M7_9SPHN|nr:serine--tRNA ligase [Qipengyuania spongiae]UVI40333.1 serine--tRNA ligase [Qipengyuania spongiae]
MHDIAFVRSNPQAFDDAMRARGGEPAADRILALDARRREALTQVQQAQSRRNEASKAIGQAMAKGDRDGAEALKVEVGELKTTMPAMEEKAKAVEAELDALLAGLPNLPAADVPQGEDEASNVEVSQWGEKREFAFEPKEHADIGPALGMDFETGAALSGARFTFLRGDIARLHRALAQFMLDRQTRENGYTECNPPVLVNDGAMYGTDKLPKFAEDSFQTKVNFTEKDFDAVTDSFFANLRINMTVEADGKKQDLVGSNIQVSDELRHAVRKATVQALTSEKEARRWLVPTSEVPLTASVADTILGDLAEPIRLTAHTLCFRSEAGSAGRDTRGFIRQHQFEKVELVSICRPEDSEAEHERMTRCAEGVLEALDLPYRRMLLCTGDMGFGARKTFDLEVWLPGQGAFREISSCSNTGDFQARRMNARYRPEGGKKTAFVHTLNGSGLAVGRTLVAVMENYQQEDGSVAVPEALAPYMGGIAKLEPVS